MTQAMAGFYELTPAQQVLRADSAALLASGIELFGGYLLIAGVRAADRDGPGLLGGDRVGGRD